MITEDYVSFEIAKLLKEKGFEVETEHEMWYVVKQFSTGCHWNSCTYKEGDITREYDEKCCITMPTLQMAMKWLREVHHLHCQIDCPAVSPIWQYGIYNLRLKDWLSTKMMGNFNTYEQAAETAIKYCLENFI